MLETVTAPTRRRYRARSRCHHLPRPRRCVYGCSTVSPARRQSTRASNIRFLGRLWRKQRRPSSGPWSTFSAESRELQVNRNAHGEPHESGAPELSALKVLSFGTRTRFPKLRSPNATSTTLSPQRQLGQEGVIKTTVPTWTRAPTRPSCPKKTHQG